MSPDTLSIILGEVVIDDGVQGWGGHILSAVLATYIVYERVKIIIQNRRKADLDLKKEENELQKQTNEIDGNQLKIIAKGWKDYVKTITDNHVVEVTKLQNELGDLRKKVDSLVKAEQECRIKVAQIETEMTLLKNIQNKQ